MDHFRLATANRHQRDYQNSYALSAVNAVALASGIAWEDSYRLLLNQAHRYGLLPNREECVRNMISEAGYCPVQGLARYSTYAGLSKYLTENHPNVTSALALTVRGYMAEKRLCAVVREENREDGFCVLDTREQDRTVVKLFLPCRGLGCEKPRPESAADLSVPKSVPEPDHSGYRYFQPNPLNNSIGDCVVRAYSAVFNVSWDEALEMIARSNEYTTVFLNAVDTYRYLLSEYGCAYHERMTRNGRGLTGEEFCRYLTAAYKNGERIFALVGNDHVVGIVPVETGHGTEYAVMDSWDSSTRKIGKYFVFAPPKEKPAPISGEAAASVRLEAGAVLVHPAYGTGTLTAADPKYVVAVFPEVGEKKLSVPWVKAHCGGL